MARYIGPVCRLCRREGTMLYLKGERCLAKCTLEERNFPPGQHGTRRAKESDYGVRLREKQKVRRIYGVLEKQFRKYYEKASRMPGATGSNLLQLLERRLDNVVYRLGLATSRASARQLIGHGHLLVNGKKVDIPSFLVRVGDVIEPVDKSKKLKAVNEAFQGNRHFMLPRWIEVDQDNLKGVVRELPIREDIPLPVNEQLIVELYSK